jgi:FAD/FMN-containing dehydrogenase
MEPAARPAALASAGGAFAGGAAALPIWNALQRAEGAAVAAPPPAAVVAVRDEAGAVAALQAALDAGLPARARGTGHHCAALCLPPGGRVIDLSAMRRVEVDAAARVARVQPGVTSAELRAAVAAHGLFFPGGHVSSVGVGGFALGGGLGWGSYALGPACDSLLAARVVVGDAPGGGAPRARAVLAAPDSEPELLWALRGAGAFVGVVTELELALRPGPAGGVVPLLVAEFPLDDAPAAWAAWAAALPTLPPGVYPNFALARGAAGAPAALALALDLAPDAAGRAAGRAALAALGAALAAAGGAVAPPADLPVLEALALHDAGGDFYPAHATYNCSAFADALGDADAAAAFFAAVLGAFRVATSPRAMLVFSPTGPRGARARAPGAFGDRAGLLWFEVLGSWERTAGGPAADGDAAHVAWALAARRAAAPWARVEYLNNSMLGHAAGGVTPRDCFWPADAERIAAAKARYDPAGVLLAFD